MPISLVENPVLLSDCGTFEQERYWYIVYEYCWEDISSCFVIKQHPINWLMQQDDLRLTFFHEISKEHYDRMLEEY